MNIELDPGTICARTNAGEMELRAPRSGLTLPQRKALSFLAAPQVFAEFAAEHRLEPVRLGRDLARLAEAGLIVLHVPPARTARSEAVPGDTFPSPRARIVAAERRPMALRIGVALALAAAIAIVWVSLRSGAAPAATGLSIPMPTAQPAANDDAASPSTESLPAPALVKRSARRTGAAPR